MTTRITSTSVTDAQDATENTPAVQLVQPDVAQATQPGLFDDIPDSALTEHHRTIIDARPGDRMLLTLSLDVSPTAARVASALAYHGWSSWPARETLGKFAGIHPNHVSRACKELEDAGIITRRRRYHQGGNVGIQYTFNGTALVAAAANQEHPVLGPAIAALVEAANTKSVSALSSDKETQSSANTNLVSAPEGDGDTRELANTNSVSADSTDDTNHTHANTNLVSAQPEAQGHEYQIGSRANTNLVREPEMIEPIDLTDIDINQSISGSSGSEETAPIPNWYSHLARQVDTSRLPDFQALQEAALLAGWTESIMASAAQIYARNYRNQRVTDPVALFRRLAIQEAGKQPPAGSQNHRAYSADYHRRRLQDRQRR